MEVETIELHSAPIVECHLVPEDSASVDSGSFENGPSDAACMREAIRSEDLSSIVNLADSRSFQAHPSLPECPDVSLRREYFDAIDALELERKECAKQVKSQMKHIVCALVAEKSSELASIAAARRVERGSIRRAAKEAAESRIWANRVEMRELKRIETNFHDDGNEEMAAKVHSARDQVSKRLSGSSLGESFAKCNVLIDRVDKRFSREEVKVQRKYEDIFRNIASVEQKQLFDIDSAFRAKRNQLERVLNHKLAAF